MSKIIVELDKEDAEIVLANQKEIVELLREILKEHSVSEDNYETIARRAKKLKSEKTPYSIYYIAKDGARDRVA